MALAEEREGEVEGKGRKVAEGQTHLIGALCLIYLECPQFSSVSIAKKFLFKNKD